MTHADRPGRPHSGVGSEEESLFESQIESYLVLTFIGENASFGSTDQ